MDPITKTIDATEKAIGHSPHPAIVFVPLGAWAVSNICDVMAMASDEESFDDAARYSMAIGLAGAVGAVATGLRDYGKIPKDRPDHDTATTHAIGNAVVGSLMVASYVIRTNDHARGRRTSPLARALALAGGALSIYTAWLGGVLVENYGEAVYPYMNEREDEVRDYPKKPVWA